MARYAYNREIEEVIEKYRLELVRQQLPISGIYLFGSYAKGTQRDESDIDLAVFWDKETFNRLDADIQLLKLTRKVDLRIEPHSFCNEDVKNPDPFVQEILSHGKRLV